MLCISSFCGIWINRPTTGSDDIKLSACEVIFDFSLVFSLTILSSLFMLQYKADAEVLSLTKMSILEGIFTFFSQYTKYNKRRPLYSSLYYARTSITAKSKNYLPPPTKKITPPPWMLLV
ncbi:unnamed protein product [Amoebophrya sp. A120]|nr:unnamed protein product [Amoebophrya sp. A120]|eukprot:GSA120T00024312001.1